MSLDHDRTSTRSWAHGQGLLRLVGLHVPLSFCLCVLLSPNLPILLPTSFCSSEGCGNVSLCNVPPISTIGPGHRILAYHFGIHQSSSLVYGTASGWTVSFCLAFIFHHLLLLKYVVSLPHFLLHVLSMSVLLLRFLIRTWLLPLL